ncbi:MAG: beta-glucuronidase [Luteolibacter sp.]
MLYPIENEIREIKNLSGLWEFKVDLHNEGMENEWQKCKLTDTIVMPVPASYNDITTDAAVRDHIGDVWYQRDFSIPRSWSDRRIVVRVGSATHHAILWVNGQEVARHKGGFLPFEADITRRIEIGGANRITLAVNNILDWSCLPSGEIKTYDETRYPSGFRTQETYFDFFNYAGIHRPVKIYTTPLSYISDIKVVTDIDDGDGLIQYSVTTHGEVSRVRVKLFDADHVLVAENAGHEGGLRVNKANLWEPGKGYLYHLVAEILGSDGNVEDSYQLPVGIRTVEVKGNQFLINGKPFYFKGFGKHEDSDIRGKGLDEAINVKDFSLMKWMGANSFRTAHYPYSEEIMRLADREGLVVIDEVPAVGMCFWSETNTVFREDRVNATTLEHHLQTVREMIARDKNHPCVVMWSIANEAATNEEAATPYFTKVAELTRSLDSTRPITIVNTMWPAVDKVSQLVDVICINRYFGWYADHGQLSVIERHADLELKDWYEKFQKPIIIAEYGADTIAGYHQLPAVSFSEEFQCDYLEQFHKAFDQNDFVIGEHVWAFADFATKQGLTRFGGNKKGIFTRQRQPKAAAFKLKERWTGNHSKW